MNLRQQLNFREGYYSINREERNLAAIFYHTLLTGNNLEKFLNLIDCKNQIVNNEVGIYFEYAFIRDLWSQKYLDNISKRKFILDMLQLGNREELEKLSILEFNKYFGAVPKPSTSDIQSPGNWSIKYYNDNIRDNHEFLNVCKFKWSFNAKPDIVIHTSHDKAICIEAKVESGEGKYPSNNKEKDIFKNRGLDFVGQLAIQKMIMENILGIESEFIFLVQKKSNSDTHKTFTWADVFDKLDTESCPYFIKEWLKRLDNHINII